MSFFMIFRVALKALGRNKMRTALTMLGMIIGVGAVIIVAHNNLDMPTLFGAIFALAFIGIGLTIIVGLMERKALFWHESSVVV